MPGSALVPQFGESCIQSMVLGSVAGLPLESFFDPAAFLAAGFAVFFFP